MQSLLCTIYYIVYYLHRRASLNGEGGVTEPPSSPPPFLPDFIYSKDDFALVSMESALNDKFRLCGIAALAGLAAQLYSLVSDAPIFPT